MRTVKPFEEFLNEGIMIKITPDMERARSLAFESERKRKFLRESQDKIGVKDENANEYVEHGHDIVLFLIRAKLYSLGYSCTGPVPHEAEVAYARKIGFSEKEIQFLDQLRYFRNGILYYGTRLDKEYAEKVIEFMEKKYPKLRELFK